MDLLLECPFCAPCSPEHVPHQRPLHVPYYRSRTLRGLLKVVGIWSSLLLCACGRLAVLDTDTIELLSAEWCDAIELDFELWLSSCGTRAEGLYYRSPRTWEETCGRCGQCRGEGDRAG